MSEISKTWVMETCKLTQGPATCAFLTMGVGGFQCGKDNGLELTIRARLQAGTMAAKGDNCAGWSKVMSAQPQN